MCTRNGCSLTGTLWASHIPCGADEGPAVFRPLDIFHLYAQCLENLGVDAPAVNSTRLKENCCQNYLSWKLTRRDVLLVFQKDVGLVLSELFIIVKLLSLAKQLTSCEDMEHNSTSGGTMRGASRRPSPPNLLQFVAILEHGADIKSSKTDLAIAQLL